MYVTNFGQIHEKQVFNTFYLFFTLKFSPLHSNIINQLHKYYYHIFPSNTITNHVEIDIQTVLELKKNSHGSYVYACTKLKIGANLFFIILIT